MKELTFAFKATATCLESIQVPNSYKTKGKTLDQIYEEVYDKYGMEKDLFYDKYIVGKKEFKKLNIEIEGVHSIQKIKMGKSSLSILQIENLIINQKGRSLALRPSKCTLYEYSRKTNLPIRFKTVGMGISPTAR